MEDARKAEENTPGNTKKKIKAKPPPILPDVPRARLQEGEVENFLRLATALKIFLGASITDEGIDRAELLFREYLCNLEEVSFLAARIYLGH